MIIMESADIGFGFCWCHAGRGLMVGANRLDGLCDYCRSRPASECQPAHVATFASRNARLP